MSVIFGYEVRISEAAGPVSEGSVARAEDKLSVKFPDEYIAFLRTYGAALLEGFEVYGIAPEQSGPPLWQDVVKANEALRAAGQLGATEKNVAISDDGMGNYLFMNCDSKQETELRISGPNFVDGKVMTFSTFVSEQSPVC